MESSGGFSQAGVGDSDDDPFAEADREFDEQIPAGEPAAAEPPIIDREGQPVEPTGEASEEKADQFGEGGELEPTFQDVPERGAPAEVPQPQESETEAEQRQAVEAGEREAERRAEIEALDNRELVALSDAAQDGSLDAKLVKEVKTQRLEAQRAAAAVEDERPTSASSAEPGEAAGSESTAAAEAGAAEADPTAAGQAAAASSPEAGSGETGDGDGGDDVAAPPTEKKGGTRRPYLLFRPDGNGRFSELAWYEDKSGKVVPKGTEGAKKQTVVLARGKETALRFGYETVLGSPKGGASLIPCAASNWIVKHVEPDEEQPVRQKLRIR